MNQKPKRYEHGCTACRYLGQYGKYDLYVCAKYGKVDTLIARYSSDGPDYVSGEYSIIGSSDTAKALREAFIRANGLGYNFDVSHANIMLRRALREIQKLRGEE